jgi:hypothetical protein
VQREGEWKVQMDRNWTEWNDAADTRDSLNG